VTRAREQGFTLIEIVVSLALATLILVGTMSFLAMQSRSHRDSMELQTMQMSVRMGLDRVLRDARSASAGFSTGTVSIQDATVVSATGLVTLPAVSLGHTVGTNASNSGPNGSDELNLVFADGRGVTNTTFDPSGVVSKLATPQTVTVLDYRGFTTASPDNFVLVSNATDAILVKVTAITPGTPTPAGSLTLAGMAAANPFPGAIASFPKGSMILTASAVTYRIDTSVFGTVEPALVVVRGGPLGITGSAEPLATQIEDLQVALGYDGLGGGVVDNFITENTAAGANLDEWAFNLAGDTQTGAITTLRALRVSLVARSVSPRPVGSDVLTVEDHVPSATGVKYLRRRLTGVASVRNLKLF
jgi:prepilin-type N-terminal cleavage/methylation domain-containing protein